MTLQYTPVILPLLLSAAGLLGLGFYAWRHRRGREGLATFALLCFACAVWALSNAIGLAGTDPGWQYFWRLFRRPVTDLSAPLTLVFVIQYAGFGGWLNRRRLIALFALSVVSGFLAWTNYWHHLIYTGFAASDWYGVASVVVERGPWWYVSTVYSYGLWLTIPVILVTTLVRAPARYRVQVAVLSAAIAIPLLVNLHYVLYPSPLEPTPIAMTISAALLTWAIFRHGLLDVIPAARHTIIENMSDAVLVLDQSHRVVDLNPAARRLVATSAASPIGQPLVELLPESARSLSAAIAGAELREAEVALEGRDYELRVSPVRNKDGAVTGRVLLLHDVTEQKHARSPAADRRDLTHHPGEHRGRLLRDRPGGAVHAHHRADRQDVPPAARRSDRQDDARADRRRDC
jgi:PAS domain S-box-containing protein